LLIVESLPMSSRGDVRHPGTRYPTIIHG
jgi:hypothetical protein